MPNFKMREYFGACDATFNVPIGRPAFTGNGENTYECWNCENVICKNLDESQVQDLVFKCEGCDSKNIFPE